MRSCLCVLGLNIDDTPVAEILFFFSQNSQ